MPPNFAQIEIYFMSPMIRGESASCGLQCSKHKGFSSGFFFSFVQPAQ
jgi:hypothetical protein